MTAGLITCGALAREVRFLIRKYNWDAEIIGIPAVDHVFPDRIAPHVEERIQSYRDQYHPLIVVYGDCGSRGALDDVLKKYQDIQRLEGPHCYYFYAGDQFQELMDQEPGSYFLTDFMVRTFNGLIKKSMGLDHYPELAAEYFRNYRQVVFLTQTGEEKLIRRAVQIAQELGFPLKVIQTGLGRLESELDSRLKNYQKTASLPQK